MREPGHVAIMHFPNVDLTPGKRRPVLLITESPSAYPDWLVCMLSSQLNQYVPELDEIIEESASDFESSGLKVPSLIRTTRVAIVSSDTLIGSIGRISPQRLNRVRKNLVAWILGETQ